jgi:transposase
VSPKPHQESRLESHHDNTIEQVFAKLKHLLRKAGARSVDAVYAAIAQSLGSFTASECANYVKNAGYGFA